MYEEKWRVESLKTSIDALLQAEQVLALHSAQIFLSLIQTI